uniref:G-patch domain-containing protein n=1 Tax=Kalanchoe fedtschenkoi TaxID=63787 RepID=A0A7N0RH97_KALFE
MKLSFSVNNGKSSSKSNRKPTANFSDASQEDHVSNQSSKFFVTEFDGSKTLAEVNRRKHVIPPKENEWNPYKKMKNLELPLDPAGKHNALDFELEVPMADSDEKMSYGLNLREGGGKVEGGDKGGAGEEPVRGRGVENVLLEKLKYDLHRLPEDRGFAEFDEVPVEGFGAALLAGYGWVEGRGIGKNAKEDVKVKEYTRRTAKEGLGFYDDKYADTRKEAKKEKVVEVQATKEDVVMEGEEKFVPGDEVRVVAGRRNIGLKGSVVEILGRDKLVLKHCITGEELEVRASDVALLGSKEEEECVRRLKELKIRPPKVEGKRVKEQRLREKRRETNKSRKEDRGSGYNRKEERKPQTKWLANHIKVRIISKEVKGGRLYCKKGKVVDVVGPTTCDLSMDDNGELVQGVEQDFLETAIPRAGGPVLVLYGEHKGIYGTLMERDGETETGIVRDADTHSLLSVSLEQMAEYVGDPAELGY